MTSHPVGGISVYNDYSRAQSISNQTTLVEYVTRCLTTLPNVKTYLASTSASASVQTNSWMLQVKAFLSLQGWQTSEHLGSTGLHLMPVHFTSHSYAMWVSGIFFCLDRNILIRTLLTDFLEKSCDFPLKILLILPIFPSSFFITYYDAETLLWSPQLTSVLICAAKMVT